MAGFRIRLRPGDSRPDALWDRIPDDHALRVGRFMAAWSLIEFKLEYIIWHLIGGDPKDLRRLTARLDTRPKQETIDELLVTHPLRTEQKEAWTEAKAAITQLIRDRNWIVHGVWVPLPFNSIGLQLTVKGGIRKDKKRQPTSVALAQIKPVTVADLDDWLSQAGETVRRLNTLLPEDGGGEPPP